MEFYDEKIKALAIEIYELDAEVYKKLGSSLGRVFGGEKDICIRNIMEDLHSRQNSSRIRSELALISNMARTIPDHDTRHDIMVRYNKMLMAISCGAVFMGANTYIGNAPNFMVKSLSDENGINMPSFFGYIWWSLRYLIPVFIIDMIIFFL